MVLWPHAQLYNNVQILRWVDLINTTPLISTSSDQHNNGSVYNITIQVRLLQTLLLSIQMSEKRTDILPIHSEHEGEGKGWSIWMWLVGAETTMWASIGELHLGSYYGACVTMSTLNLDLTHPIDPRLNCSQRLEHTGYILRAETHNDFLLEECQQGIGYRWWDIFNLHYHWWM